MNEKNMEMIEKEKERGENMKKQKMKTRLLSIGAAAVLFTGIFCFVGCGNSDSDNSGAEGGDKSITVISREDGSGTRDAFTELTGVMEDDVDNTVETAEISNSTTVVIQSVAGNENAIGYISLGSMDDVVKAAQVDGVDATTANVLSGDYKLQRPFNIVTKGELKGLPQDFMNYVLSSEGQAIIEEEGYIKMDEEASPYEGGGLKGSITLAGSTSVSPVIEVLAEAYKGINEGVTIEIQQTGSGAGIQSTIEGACDIGMASRDLAPEEESEGLSSTTIAKDGIAVILNKANDIKSITTDQLKQIYTGKVTYWSELK